MATTIEPSVVNEAETQQHFSRWDIYKFKIKKNLRPLKSFNFTLKKHGRDLAKISSDAQQQLGKSGEILSEIKLSNDYNNKTSIAKELHAQTYVENASRISSEAHDIYQRLDNNIFGMSSKDKKKIKKLQKELDANAENINKLANSPNAEFMAKHNVSNDPFANKDLVQLKKIDNATVNNIDKLSSDIVDINNSLDFISKRKNTTSNKEISDYLKNQEANLTKTKAQKEDAIRTAVNLRTDTSDSIKNLKTKYNKSNLNKIYGRFFNSSIQNNFIPNYSSTDFKATYGKMLDKQIVNNANKSIERSEQAKMILEKHNQNNQYDSGISYYTSQINKNNDIKNQVDERSNTYNNINSKTIKSLDTNISDAEKTLKNMDESAKENAKVDTLINNYNSRPRGILRNKNTQAQTDLNNRIKRAQSR